MLHVDLTSAKQVIISYPHFSVPVASAEGKKTIFEFNNSCKAVAECAYEQHVRLSWRKSLPSKGENE